MAANAWREPSIQFDLFELDAPGCQLRRNGLPVDLPPQALRILGLLASRPDQLVTRKEIKEALWPDESHGDFDSRLNFSVKKLREALGDNAERPRYIQTERKAGYRFIAPIRSSPLPSLQLSSPQLHLPQGSLAGAADVAATPPGPTPVSAAPAGFQFGRTALLAALLAFACFAALGSFILRARGTNPAVATESIIGPASADDSKPEISFVTPILPQARQRIVIQGRGFGIHVPYAHTDSPYLAIRDDTAHWAAGRLVPHNWDEVMLDVESWKDDEIVISGFSGDYGKNGWKLTEGDELEIAIWNPQNGVGPARYRVSVASPTPSK
ncbi:MAG: winged helix-turn-helix domain-containing protein [Terriglobales bacterium]|jgi:DNA-binding winged helix-turn-helix (wHTH) protein